MNGPKIRRCSHCGCTDEIACYQKGKGACYWVAESLCSFCRDLSSAVRDIIVTTPKSQMKIAAEEARQCIADGGGVYFRTFPVRPRGLYPGTRIFYAEDGYIRGFAVVSEVYLGGKTCETSGRTYGHGYNAVMPAWSWKWIRPIAMRGFQGYRYLPKELSGKGPIVIVGDWKDPRPAAIEGN